MVSRPALGSIQPSIQWITGGLTLWVKRQGREAGHSPSSSAEVKNEWIRTFTPQYAFMAWCSVKSQGQLYLFSHNHSFSIPILLGIAQTQRFGFWFYCLLQVISFYHTEKFYNYF
jgi:hypothetical protein